MRVQRRLLRELPELVAQKKKGHIDLRFIGKVYAQAPANPGRVRPLRPGSSVAHYTLTAGTLGCFVRKSDDATFLGVLSCQHVLSQLLAAAPGPAEHTTQPGKADSGRMPGDRIGHCAITVPIPNPPAHRVKRRNMLDCAVGRIDPADAPAPLDRVVIPGVGPVTATESNLVPYLNRREMVVRKQGRTTGLTKGYITAINLDKLVVTYAQGSSAANHTFTGVFEIEALGGGHFSKGGDSGSLIVDSDGRALGLVFAGMDHGGTNDGPRTFAIPIRPVLAALGVSIPGAQ